MSSTAALVIIAVTLVVLALATVAGIRYLSAVLVEAEEGNGRLRRGSVN